MASPLAQPSRFPTKSKQGKSFLAGTPGPTAAKTRPSNLPSLGPAARSRAEGVQIESVADAATPAQAGITRQASTPSFRRPPQRTASAARVASLGDPKVERILPKLSVNAGVKVFPHELPADHSEPPKEEAPEIQRVPSSVALRRGVRLSPALSPKASIPEAPLAPSEASALQEISSIAGSVSASLDKVISSCGSMGEDRVESDTANLHDICVISRTVRETLHDADEYQSDQGAQPVEQYDDATLAKARRITQFTMRFVEELGLQNMSEVQPEEEGITEVASLREISAVTAQVCQSMHEMMGGAWADAVLRDTARDAEAEREAKAKDAEAADQKANENALADRRKAELQAIVVEKNAGASETDEQGSPELPMTPLSNQGAPKVASVEGLPDLEELLAHHKNHDNSFSDKDIIRMQTAFKRFKIPDSADLHTDKVCTLLRYLGHVMTQEDGVMPLVKEVTSYDYLDFDEFLSFMDAYIPYEKEKIKEVFVQFDDDGSGGISLTELRTLLKSLGFIPLHAIIAEALSVVGGNGEDLDFDQFVTFLAIYRRAEGFCHHEVVELRRLFDFFSKPNEEGELMLPPSCLSDALVQNFGLQVSSITETFEASMKGPSNKVEDLRFPEFLIYARKTREESLSRLRGDYPDLDRKAVGNTRGAVNAASVCYEACDEDNNGLISEAELRSVLRGMGYTPLRQNVEEIFGEVDKDHNHELDFNEFFDFMLIFRQREGFRKKVVEDMRKVFERFDTDGTGEISALELADLFRELGFTNSLDEIYIFVAQVDENNSGQLDFREYLHLMRLHREKELERMEGIFDCYKDEQTHKLSHLAVVPALEELDFTAPKSAIMKCSAGVDFDGFVGIVDSCRAERVAKERKKAGFSEEKIAELQELFDRFDKDHGGEIDTMELMGILDIFGWKPKTRQDQIALVKKLDVARQRTREAGVKDISPDGSGHIKFWTFVQLARMLETEQAHAEEDRMQSLMKELKFTQKEVEQFREIFLAKKTEFAEQKAASMGTEPVDLKGLPRDAIRRLIKALGVAIIGEKKPMLDEELQSLGCGENGLLDFFGFLQLMRWLMETGWLK